MQFIAGYLLGFATAIIVLLYKNNSGGGKLSF